MNDLLFDTCFLIDFQRERRRGEGAAHRFLENHAAAQAWICWTVVGEFSEGFEEPEDPACVAQLSGFRVLPMERPTALCYAKITARLRAEGRLIGANDLWIAAAAMAAGFPLVTNNVDHFSRIAGLSVVRY